MNDFNTKLIPYLGDRITISGAGFLGRPSLKCFATPGNEKSVTIVSDTMVLCSLKYGDLSASTQPLYLRDADTSSQGYTLLSRPGLQKIAQSAIITNVYVLHPSQPGVHRDYITRCSPGSQLVIEGFYLGFDPADINAIEIANLTPFYVLRWSFPGGAIASMNSSMIISGPVTTVPANVWSASPVLYRTAFALAGASDLVHTIRASNDC